MLLLPAVAAAEPPPGMVPVPAGSFTMGRDDAPHADERPAHTVHISAFLIDARLVTVADFAAYVDETGAVTAAERLGYGMVSTLGMDDWRWRRVPGASWRHPLGPGRDEELGQADDHPVVDVSWHDADAYCRHLGKRLPTEAEWEYAMRAGATGRFPWGDHPGADGQPRLNYWEGRSHRENSVADGYVYTAPVDAYPPNEWGIFGPVGNVWQWTADWYAADTYARQAPEVTDPEGPATGWARVGRGGSWWCSATTCSGYGLWARGKARPNAPYPNIGFRCAMDATKTDTDRLP